MGGWMTRYWNYNKKELNLTLGKPKFAMQISEK
jgi:hypothetical protein